MKPALPWPIEAAAAVGHPQTLIPIRTEGGHYSAIRDVLTLATWPAGRAVPGWIEEGITRYDGDATEQSL